jgi:glucuronate isomerase
MRYKWVVEDSSDVMQRKMNRLAEQGYRMVGYGDDNKQWWVIMEKEDGPDEVRSD